MKHIKSYKIFEGVEPPKGADIETIRDICYDITDGDKFKVDFKTENVIVKHIIISLVNSKTSFFKISEISEFILRLSRYLGDNLMLCELSDGVRYCTINIPKIEDNCKYYDGYFSKNLDIYFK